MKNKIIAIIAISWLFGLTCCQLFIGIKHPVSSIQHPVSSIKDQVSGTEKKYQQATKQLQQTNDILQKELLQTSQSLIAVKQQNKQLLASLQYSINEQQQYKQEKDTIASLSNCDSVISNTAAYIISAAMQDSLQEIVKEKLRLQLQNRDSVITVKEDQYKELRQQINNSLAQQQQLATALNKSSKQLKRRQLGSKIKNAGILLLSGLLLSKSL